MKKKFMGRGGSFCGKMDPKSQRCGHPGIVAGLPRMGYKAKLEGT